MKGACCGTPSRGLPWDSSGPQVGTEHPWLKFQARGPVLCGIFLFFAFKLQSELKNIKHCCSRFRFFFVASPSTTVADQLLFYFIFFQDWLLLELRMLGAYSIFVKICWFTGVWSKKHYRSPGCTAGVVNYSVNLQPYRVRNAQSATFC